MFGVSHWRQSLPCCAPSADFANPPPTVVLFWNSSMTQRRFRAAPGLFSLHLSSPLVDTLAPASPGSLRQSSSRGMAACLRVDNPHRLFVKKTPNCRGNYQLTTGAVTAWAYIRLP